MFPFTFFTRRRRGDDIPKKVSKFQAFLPKTANGELKMNIGKAKLAQPFWARISPFSHLHKSGLALSFSKKVTCIFGSANCPKSWPKMGPKVTKPAQSFEIVWKLWAKCLASFQIRTSSYEPSLIECTLPFRLRNAARFCACVALIKPITTAGY